MRLVLITLLACAALSRSEIKAQESELDPSKSEVVLGERAGWRATLALDAGVGVWAVKSFQLFDQYACPELVACDDKGRATILIGYSGKWTPKTTIADGKWTAPMCLGHFGMGKKTLLVGGAGGRLYEIRPRAEGHSDIKLTKSWPGEEIHTLLTLDVRLWEGHDRALVFMKSGRMFEYRSSDVVEVFEMPRVEGRVRDAVVSRYRVENGTHDFEVATVSRAGALVLRKFRVEPDKVISREDELILQEPMGLGRIACGEKDDHFYVSRDDGLILSVRPSTGRIHADGPIKIDAEQLRKGSFEHVHDGNGSQSSIAQNWTRMGIYRSEQGPRGIVSGRFTDEPGVVESLAIFGYSGRVELLTRKWQGSFEAETIFVAKDKGHWLAVAELDGRNETQEIVASGYSGRVVVLSRLAAGMRNKEEPTFSEPAQNPEQEKSEEKAATIPAEDRLPLRIAVEKIPEPREIDPLRYGGGFLTKTSTFDTLVRKNAEGELAPGLAKNWWFEDEGRTWSFILDTEVQLQDGKTLNSKIVADHFAKIKAAPEHSWLGLSRLLESIETPRSDLIVFRLSEPWAIEEELIAVNPCGIMAPGSFDDDGKLLRPLGSGPLRPQVADRKPGRLTYVDRSEQPVIELVKVDGGPEAMLAAWRAGEVDLVFDAWEKRVPKDLPTQTPRSRFMNGSFLIYLSFNLENGPMAETKARQHLATFIDRSAIMKRATRFGRQRSNWFAVSSPRTPWMQVGIKEPIDVLACVEDAWQADVARALDETPTKIERKRLFRARVLPRAEYEAARLAGDYDALVERSWGRPYDPLLSLLSRFDPPQPESAVNEQYHGLNPNLREMVRKLARTPERELRRTLSREINTFIAQEVPALPLFEPVRIILMPKSAPRLEMPQDIYSLPLEQIMELR